VPPPFGTGGRGTLAGERGGGRVPISTSGHTLWYSVHIYMYFVRTGNIFEETNALMSSYLDPYPVPQNTMQSEKR
jgi:hypothetical protein